MVKEFEEITFMMCCNNALFLVVPLPLTKCQNLNGANRVQTEEMYVNDLIGNHT
jgi:hypothetical protein